METENRNTCSSRNVFTGELKSNPRSKERLNNSSKSSAPAQPQSTFTPPANWVDAPEFVPRWLAASSDQSEKEQAALTNPISTKPRSYAAVVGTAHATVGNTNSSGATNGAKVNYWEEWCPYHMLGECRFGDQCLMIHGVKCDYCGEFRLHPTDVMQRDKHVKECIEEHEKDMELSFAVARSLDKTCGICYENVMAKEPASEQRFGILPSCNHCFCLSCLRRWRQARQFENKIIRACPECRVTSDFVCPSRYWVENKEDKDKLIGCYKIALRQKPCRYYRNGEGQCPFGNKCFYLHALTTGQVVDVGPPRRILGAEGRVPGSGQNTSLWDYMEDWELQWMDIEEIMEILELGDGTVSEFLEDLDVVDDTFDYWRRSQ
ncbi:unnamed protein product [Orchesella dallaii]|uniref:RING-type E3 ubiquitin transferase n=1 Tax=Orchesella dallaii TaxID=48710 RepID=A0ABP1S2P3_9HEXA